MGAIEPYTQEHLKMLQGLPLERKIMLTQAKIIEWYTRHDGNVYVSFSGGKDSTVLLDLARRIYPEIPAIFINTGLEYPEVRQFAMGYDNVEEMRPRWGRMAKRYGKKSDAIITPFDIVQTFGYPLISKAVGNAIVKARKTSRGSRWERLHGNYKKRDGSRSQFDYSKYLPLSYLPILISDECCKIAKKRPDRTYQREAGRHPLVATMAEESQLRKQAWLHKGCNVFDTSDPISKPMSFWTEQDVLHYIMRFDIKICSVYGDVCYLDSDGFLYGHTDITAYSPDAVLKCSGCQRTGCVFCAFGVHLEKGETRYQRLKKTHPKLYKYCIDGGEWQQNRYYDSTKTGPDMWNPKEVWGPSRTGLGMGKVFDMVNEIYGGDFIRYE